MKRVQTLKAVTGAILATSMLAGVPAAQAQDWRGGRQSPTEASERQRGNSAQAQSQRAERSQSDGQRSGGWRGAAERAQQVQVRPAPQQAPRTVPDMNRSDRRSATAQERSGRDWNRSDRRSETAHERSGRDWNRSDRRNEGAPNQWERSAEQKRIYEQQQRERNASYRDGSRNGSYTDRNRDGDRRWDGERRWEGQRDGGRYRDGDHRYGDGHHRDWDRRWRDNNRYNWYQYRAHNRDLYRMGRYYSPYSDYRYRRIGVGFTLGSLFYSSRYWIDDPWRYRLPQTYGPYRWVRYYDDVMLVDMYSGRVVDVINNFFW